MAIVSNGTTIIDNGSLAAGLGGKVLQVVQTTKTSFFSTTSTNVDITGASVTITPSSTSSKILLIVSGQYGTSNDSYGHIKVLRGSTTLDIGDARGSTTRATTSAGLRIGGGQSDAVSRAFAINLMDTPNTTSATTYKLQMIRITGTICVGGALANTSSHRGSFPTFLTAIEVAG